MNDTKRLAEKRTHLAEVRTELAHRRTMSADLRTTTTLVLFGIAFLGFSEERWDFFFISGLLAITVGVLYLMLAFDILMHHSKRIRKIRKIFHRIRER